VVDLLDRHRLVAITGAGGIGKTRLARAVFAARLAGYTDGASFIELAPLGDPALVAATIAAALQVSVGTARPALQAIVSSLRNALRPFNG
jgi:predicted ATPase